jgi:hypothetical protein
MTAKVQIQIEAQDAATGVLRAITQQFGKLGEVTSGFADVINTSKYANQLYQKALKDTSISAGQVAQAEEMARVSMVRFAETAVMMTIEALKDAVKVTMEYSQQVRDLSLASGASAEEASRMIQVLDDYQITAEDAKVATRALTREGLAPTVDTLIKLSEEYNKLSTAEERNAFVQENLGRGGQEWLNLLAQGPDKIRALNDAVSENLILTEKNIQAAEEYRLALDEWGDAVQGAKVQAGTQLLPVLADLLQATTAGSFAVQEEVKWYERAIPILGVLHQAKVLHRVATEESAAATEQATGAQIEFSTTLDSTNQYYRNYVNSIESSIPTLAEVKAQTEAISEVNKQYIGVLGEVGSALDTYNSGIAEANAALAEGNIKADEHAARVAELAAEYENASNRIALSIVEMKLATDGWTRAELAAYLKVGQQLDIFTTEQIKATEAALDMADAALAGVEPILHVGERAEDAADGFGIMEESAGALGDTINKTALPAVAGLKSAINGLPPTGTSWSYDFFINVNGRVPQLATATYSTGAGYNTTVHPGGGGRQTGGQVYAGNPYMVGEGGAEPFVPSQSGRILGHAESLHALTLAGGKGGNSTNVFYGTVYISPDAQAGGDIMSIR